LKESLLKLLGIEVEPILERGGEIQTEFVWTNAVTSYWVFVFIFAVAAILYGIFWLYRREMSGCPKPVRLLLGVFRAVVMVLLLLVLLGPALSVSQSQSVEPYILVLIDDSASMAMQDRFREEGSGKHVEVFLGKQPGEAKSVNLSRVQLVERLLKDEDARLLRGLSQHGIVQLYRFSDTFEAIDAIQRAPAHGPGSTPETAEAADTETDGEPDGDDAADDGAEAPVVAENVNRNVDWATALPELKAKGQGTNLAKAIRAALKDKAGNPVAAIVVITDGQNNEGDDPHVAAEAAGEANIPVHFVGVGDTSRPRNLRVVDVWAEDTVWKGDPFSIEATIKADGIDADTIEVIWTKRLAARETGSESEGVQTIKTEKVVVADGVPTRPVVLEDLPAEPGTYIYSVKITPEEGEQHEADNSDDVVVNVLDNKARVLLVSGGPTWQYRTLRPLLQRDDTIDVSCWLQSMDLTMQQEGNTPITDLPDTEEKLNEYDVVIMLDPDPDPRGRPNDFSEEWIRKFERFVDRGGGFLYMAGPKFSSRFLTTAKTRPILSLLPVRMKPGAGVNVELSLTHTREWRIELTPAGADHPVTKFVTDTSLNERIWQAMPGLYWTYPVQGPKPGAETLLERDEPGLQIGQGQMPLIVVGKYGPGRTMYMGFDSSWRWRRVGHDSEFYEKFWIQTVRYLIQGKQLGTKRRGTIGTDQDTYTVGKRVLITARLLDEKYQPLTVDEIPATLQSGPTARGDVTLKKVPNKAGYYEASVIATNRGLNELVVVLPGDGTGVEIRLTSQFTVELPNREINDTRLNRPLLVSMADRSSGQYFDIDAAYNVISHVPDRRESIVITGKPIALWSTWRLLAVLVALLGLEWAVRKYFKLL